MIACFPLECSLLSPPRWIVAGRRSLLGDRVVRKLLGDILRRVQPVEVLIAELQIQSRSRAFPGSDSGRPNARYRRAAHREARELHGVQLLKHIRAVSVHSGSAHDELAIREACHDAIARSATRSADIPAPSFSFR